MIKYNVGNPPVFKTEISEVATTYPRITNLIDRGLHGWSHSIPRIFLEEGGNEPIIITKVAVANESERFALFRLLNGDLPSIWLKSFVWTHQQGWEWAEKFFWCEEGSVLIAFWVEDIKSMKDFLDRKGMY